MLRVNVQHINARDRERELIVLELLLQHEEVDLILIRLALFVQVRVFLEW